MKLLHSIEAIEADNIFRTGCKPIRVHCNDLGEYVCKYHKGTHAANRLFREYIAACFLKIWKLPVPEFGFVKLRKEHIPTTLRLGNINFEYPAFGSLYRRDGKEVDVFLTAMDARQRKKFIHWEHFLAIAFFDIWIGNDDRHPGNFNLLLSAEEGSYRFIPIDHESCFHTGNYDKENYTISPDESLLSSPFLPKLLPRLVLQDHKYFMALKTNWYICMQNCDTNLHAILDRVPGEWQIPPNMVYGQIKRFMFSDQWFEICWNTFLGYIQLTINKA